MYLLLFGSLPGALCCPNFLLLLFLFQYPPAAQRFAIKDGAGQVRRWQTSQWIRTSATVSGYAQAGPLCSQLNRNTPGTYSKRVLKPLGPYKVGTWEVRVCSQLNTQKTSEALNAGTPRPWMLGLSELVVALGLIWVHNLLNHHSGRLSTVSRTW